jgi:hypothetical protein
MGNPVTILTASNCNFSNLFEWTPSVREWNKLENSVRNLDIPLKFKRALLNNANEINFVPKHFMYGPRKLNTEGVNDEFIEESLQKGTIRSLPLCNG